jgi:hypothetical protein
MATSDSLIARHDQSNNANTPSLLCTSSIVVFFVLCYKTIGTFAGHALLTLMLNGDLASLASIPKHSNIPPTGPAVGVTGSASLAVQVAASRDQLCKQLPVGICRLQKATSRRTYIIKSS